eukprot:gene5337-6657_t
MINNNKLLILVTFLLFFIISVVVTESKIESEITCLDENGKAVDWWVIQKLPTLTGTDGRFLKGLAYAYADKNSESLNLTDKWLDDHSNALGYTLNQIYDNRNSDDLMWLMYNDQPPESKVSSDYAHSKGVLALTNKTGFWLIHSTPRFPLVPSDSENTYHFPSNEVRNGQSYLCISFDSKESLDTISRKLFINRPYIYNYKIPTGFPLKTTDIEKLLMGGFESLPTGETSELKSRDGLQFKVFAKNKEWNQDLYESLLQSSIKQDMIITTWRLGAGYTIMPTFCQPKYTWDSVNSLQLKITHDAGVMYTWRYTKDHSKWAISLDDDNQEHYVCIGDINRMYSQFKRGGGTACFINNKLWQSYFNLVSNADFCTVDDRNVTTISQQQQQQQQPTINIL